MAEQRYIDFLRKLIEDTKATKIHWKYLDKNERLYRGMGWIKPSGEGLFSGTLGKTVIDFNSEDSFFANIKGTYIVIYVWENQPAVLYVVPETYKKVTILTPDEYGDYITRLLNLVQSQFPNAEGFIESYISDITEEKNDDWMK